MYSRLEGLVIISKRTTGGSLVPTSGGSSTLGSYAFPRDLKEMIAKAAAPSKTARAHRRPSRSWSVSPSCPGARPS
jgi:hypothetical protein